MREETRTTESGSCPLMRVAGVTPRGRSHSQLAVQVGLTEGS